MTHSIWRLPFVVVTCRWEMRDFPVGSVLFQSVIRFYFCKREVGSLPDLAPASEGLRPEAGATGLEAGLLGVGTSFGPRRLTSPFWIRRITGGGRGGRVRVKLTMSSSVTVGITAS